MVNDAVEERAPVEPGASASPARPVASPLAVAGAANPLSRRTLVAEVVSGVEGPSLYVANHHVAGPKPWGGGPTMHRFRLRLDALATVLREHGFDLTPAASASGAGRADAREAPQSTGAGSNEIGGS